MRRLLAIFVPALVLSGIAVWWSDAGRARSDNKPSVEAQGGEKKKIGFEVSLPALDFMPVPPSQSSRTFYDPITIAPCTLMPLSEQDVSSQVDGVFQDVLIELGQQVKGGSVLGRLDDRQLRAHVELVEIRAASASAERIAKAQFDEADSKLQYALKANASGLTTVPELEYKTYLFQRERFAQEMKKASEERAAAGKELEKAKVVLDLHEIRSAIDGEVIKIYKRRGEAVKQAEPVFRIANCNALRVEGLCKMQEANLLRIGMRALLEPELRGEQIRELIGHTGPITALAISPDGHLLASAGEDRNVFLWAWPEGQCHAKLPHPAEVTAVAIAAERVILTGCADGQVRFWRVVPHGKIEGPFVFPQGHEGGVRALALSPDGKTLATGGDDTRIALWDLGERRHLLWLESDDALPAHQGAVTSLHFTADGKLISAGRDNTLKVWNPSADNKLVQVHVGRTGEVTELDTSPKGQVLLDMGDELRLVDRERGACLGSLRNQKQGRFQSFARFSADGNLLLTASSNSRVQLWQVTATSPVTNHCRGQELRHFVIPSNGLATCGLFAPDSSVCFTAGTDKTVRVWAIPSLEERSQALEARITYIGSQVERGTETVRIRAELENPSESGRRLRAGIYAVMRVFPEAAALQ